MPKPNRSFNTGGGLFNILEANAKYEVPAVGTGATFLHYSDRSPGTVVAVREEGGRWYVGVQPDRAFRLDKNGQSEVQEYRYERDRQAPISWFRATVEPPQPSHSGPVAPRVQWEPVEIGPTGRWRKSGGPHILFGDREKYVDPCF